MALQGKNTACIYSYIIDRLNYYRLRNIELFSDDKYN